MNNSEEGRSKGSDKSTPRLKLPINPSLEYLRKQARRRLRQTPSLKLAEAQHQLAQDYGCKNWAELARRVKAMSCRATDPLSGVGRDEALSAILHSDVQGLASILDENPAWLCEAFDATNDLQEAGAAIDLRGATLLHIAVEFGERACVELLLNRGADINARARVIDGIGGQTPIFHAIANPKASEHGLLGFLLERTAPWIDMSTRVSFRRLGERIGEVTPLEYALRGLSVEKKHELELLRTADFKSQLKNAIRGEDLAVASRLLDAEPSLLDVDLWPIAIYQAKSLPMTRLLLDRGLDPNRCSAPRLPLHLAVYQVLPEIVECLLQAGADAVFRNPLGETPLDLLDAYESRLVGDPDVHRIKELLLAAGAEMDLLVAVRLGDAAYLDALLREGTPLHRDALHAAARSGRPEAAVVLLQHGADPNQVNEKGNTPLWFAAQSPAQSDGRIAVMKLLLDAGADLHQRCERGSTALHFAAWRGPVEVAEFLLSRGARSDAADDKGKTPLDDALMRPDSLDREAVIALLRR